MEIDTPDWAKNAVWYQIFPERFRNGARDNDPPCTVPWTHRWDAPYQSPAGSPGAFEEIGHFTQYIFSRRYGGDLQGIREKLEYLRELGITAIYLNPMFQAPSLHKYDTADLRHIDDFFGIRDSRKKIVGETLDPKTWQWTESDRLFLDFLKDAHQLGFRVIIDGVFNHVGREFWAFQDVLAHGRRSDYADWFDVTSWMPFHYKAWDGDDGSLPRFKHDDLLGLGEPVREHLFAITRRWMDPDGDGDPSDGVDGWRLDAAGDINFQFWNDWRKLAKSINPDAFLVGELWEESKRWLDGQKFDAVMNYPFAVRSRKFFVSKTAEPTAFDHDLKEMVSWYAPSVTFALQNLLGSHDTDRVASMFMNPTLEYDRNNSRHDNPHYNDGKPTAEAYQRMRALVAFQMTYLGAPMIYYGDEVGMYGADDPSDRKPMLWVDLPPNDDPDERIVPGMLDHYRRMIAIRNTFECLRLGTVRTLETRDDAGIYAFCRTLGDESIAVVINNGDNEQLVTLPSPWPDGSHPIRLDDPRQCELVAPPADDPKLRPTVRRLAHTKSELRIEGGRVHGLTIGAHSVAILGAGESPSSRY